MLRFFRKIRQELLEQGQLRNYFFYAIGEIFLVVLGILIALQLNNFNASLKQARQEQESLINLRSDFEYNQIEIKRVIAEMKKNRDFTRRILDQTGYRYTHTFVIDSFLGEVTSTSRYHPRNGFLMDLINSGKLGIIESDELRNRLSSWLPELERLKERERTSLEFDYDVVRYVFKHGSWLNADEVDDDQFIRDLGLPESGFEVDNNRILQSLEFENRIENQIIYQTLLINRQEICEAEIEEILNLLDRAIHQ